MHLPVSPLPLHITMICICWKWFHAAQIVTTGTYFKDISTKSNESSSSLSKETDFTLQEEMFRCGRDNECKNLGRKTGTEKLSDVCEGASLSQYDEILEKEETGMPNMIMGLCMNVIAMVGYSFLPLDILKAGFLYCTLVYM